MARIRFTVTGGEQKVSPAVIGRRCDFWINGDWIGEVKVQEAASVRDGYRFALIGSPRVAKETADLLSEGRGLLQLHPVRRPLRPRKQR